MNNEELIRFNPILAEALTQAEAENPLVPREYLRELVAVSVKVGISPDKIYALIKTGRILTNENMKLLSRADIKEWQDACDEYSRLADLNVHGSKEESMTNPKGDMSQQQIQAERGELVSKIGPLSIFRSATALYHVSEDDKETETTIENRYTISIDPAWFKNNGVVAVELAPKYYSVKTGNRLDNVGSLVELSQAPDGEESDVSVLVLDPTSTEDSESHEEALLIRCK